MPIARLIMKDVLGSDECPSKFHLPPAISVLCYLKDDWQTYPKMNIWFYLYLKLSNVNGSYQLITNRVGRPSAADKLA